MTTNDEFFTERAKNTAARVAEWSAAFEEELGVDGRSALSDGCVYAVGSAGRGELGGSSDLDVFIVTNGEPSRVNEALVQAPLIRMMRRFKLPPPSNDATFLRLHGASELEHRLGAVNDDSPQNTFTARMLLLLESRPFYGQEAYKALLRRVVQAYWRNEQAHADHYLPMVLVNDIVRYWRVVLLNYEAKFASKEREAKMSGELEQVRLAKWLASYKLRFARCMTCYSMIIVLLWQTREQEGKLPHVSQDMMLELIGLTPVQRLQAVLAEATGAGAGGVVTLVDELLALYAGYLASRTMRDDELKGKLRDRSNGPSLFERADTFGDRMAQLVQELGRSSRLIRYVVV